MGLFLAATAGAQPRWGTRGLGEEHLQSDYSGEEGEDARALPRTPCHWLVLP